MIQNTSNQDPLLQLLTIIDGAGAGIEAQEKRGQQQLVASSQLPAKNNGREDLAAFYAGCGIQVIGQTKGDGLFLDVHLPEGWKIVATDHSMWSNLVDGNGSARASIFYKAAFYDREAFINMLCRYRLSFDRHESKDEWRYSVVDHRSGTALLEQPWAEYGVAEKRRELAASFLAENYPEHEDAIAYWND